jgi:chromosome segregation ATPase
VGHPKTQATKQDLRTAQKTLDFLSERLRTAQYRLHDCQRKRRSAQRDEATTRLSIQAITRRIQRELAAHPTLYPTIPRGQTGG